MRPIFKVLADDTDITAKIADRLLSLTVTDEAGVQSDTVEIRIDNREQKVKTPPKGVKLKVWLGYEASGLVYQGAYVVDETEVGGPPDYLVIKGKSADMTSEIKAQKTRSWDETTLGAIVSAIAAEHGLTPAVSSDLASIAVDHEDQTDESDLHFLTRLAEEHDAVAKPANGRFVFAKRGEAKSLSGAALTPVAINPAAVGSWSLTKADRGKYTAVVAAYHDQGEAEKVDVRVGETKGSAYRLRDPYPTEDAARAAAEAKLAALKRGEATLSLTLNVGVPTAAAEAPLTVSGLHADAEGAWIISKVTHTFDKSGLKSTIETETKG